MNCFGTYFTHVQTCDVTRSKCYGMDCFGTYFTHVQTCDTDSFHYVLDAMEHPSGFAKAWVSLADISSEVTVTSEQALEALTLGAGLDLFSMNADNSWRLSDSFAFVSPRDSAT